MVEVIEVDFGRGRMLANGTKEYQLVRVRRRADSFGRQFSVIFSDAARELALAGGSLRPTAWRCLMQAIAEFEFERFRVCVVGSWAEELGVTPSAISKAMAQLVVHGWLEGSARSGYRLSPRLGWRGVPAQYHKRCREIAAEAQLHLAMRESEPA